MKNYKVKNLLVTIPSLPKTAVFFTNADTVHAFGGGGKCITPSKAQPLLGCEEGSKAEVCVDAKKSKCPAGISGTETCEDDTRSRCSERTPCPTPSGTTIPGCVPPSKCPEPSKTKCEHPHSHSYKEQKTANAAALTALKKAVAKLQKELGGIKTAN